VRRGQFLTCDSSGELCSVRTATSQYRERKKENDMLYRKLHESANHYSRDGGQAWPTVLMLWWDAQTKPGAINVTMFPRAPCHNDNLNFIPRTELAPLDSILMVELFFAWDGIFL
jgi:hypothetical protein